VQGLRKILESVYSYFSYDVNEYIADKLEQENTESTTELTRTQPQATIDSSPPHNGSSNTELEQPLPEPKQPSKTISNFTVENILSGPQRNSTSSSSISPSSHSTGSNRSPTDYSSILPANWVSHPPVKYTKYTMLSPKSMGDDKSKKRPSVSGTDPRPRHHSSSTEGSRDFQKLSMRRVPSNPISRVPSGDRVPYSFPTSSNGSLLSADELKSQSGTYINSKSVSTLPVIQAIPYTTAVGGKTLLQQSFPPSQQFVLLVPSTSATVNDQTLVYSTQAQTKPTPIRINGTELPKEHTVSEQDKRLMEVSYRPIAPKNKTIFREMQPTTTNAEKKGFRRTPSGTKPQKLRFHMTTVVKRPRNSSVMTSSMTVESPSVASERTKTTSFVLEPQSSVEAQAEKSITKTENSYSSHSEDECNRQSPQSNLSPIEVASNTSYEHEDSTLGQSSPSSEIVKQRPEVKKELTFIHCHEDKQFEIPAPDNGRTTRSYTRRKRELTFHLYEDPATAFKPKRNCKE